MILAAIAAADENNVIGRDNDLPWHLPKDLKHFKATTLGHPIIMGRKTLESFGKPLPKRKNIIVSRNRELKIEGATVAPSIDDAIRIAQLDKPEMTFIIGGEEIFRQSFHLLDRIYLTRVHTEVRGDTYFPEIPMDNFITVSAEEHSPDEKHEYGFTILLLERKRAD